MGISSGDLDILIMLKEQGYITHSTSMIEIGAQQLSNTFLSASIQIEKLAHLFGASLPHPFSDPSPSHIVHGELEHLNSQSPPARIFWKWLGFNYKSIDLDGSHDSIPLDLNYDDAPKNAMGRYPLVTNFGTTEHVANQLNAFKIIHDLTAVGGTMIHNLPAQGMLNHGLVNYNPKFFWMLARSNGYKWLYIDFTSATSYYELPQNIVDHVAQYNSNIVDQSKNYQTADAGLIVVLQKVFDTPYVSPLDVPTGTEINNKVLEERYWSIFKKDPFE